MTSSSRKDTSLFDIVVPEQNITSTRRRALHILFERFSRDDLSRRGPGNPGEPPSEEATGQSTRFAAAIGIHRSLLSHLRRERPISDKVARQIETNLRNSLQWLDVESGWMDQEHDSSALTNAEQHLLDLALAAYRTLNAGRKRDLLKLLRSIPQDGWPADAGPSDEPTKRRTQG